MRLLILTLSLLFTLQTASAQNNVISITSEGTVSLPADLIQFHITVNAGGDSPQAAYQLHREREKSLVRLLEQYQIEEKNIHFEPISIQRNRNGQYRGDEKEYQTRQSVSLTLKDFETYEKIQVTLIEEGFDSFQGNFSSTELEQGKDRALKEAIAVAKEKAKLIAAETGVKLGNIQNINYRTQHIGPVYASEQRMTSMSAPDGLMKYDQQITVSASISIDFKFFNR